MDMDARWSATYDQYKGKVRTFARNSYQQMPGYSIEDVEQELLVVLWECVRHYDPNKGASFNTYFQGSARNRVITLVRHFSTKSRKAVVTSLDVEAVASAVDQCFAQDSAETTAERRAELQAAVAEYGEAALNGRRGRRRKAVAA